jgi:hypothetical protein
MAKGKKNAATDAGTTVKTNAVKTNKANNLVVLATVSVDPGKVRIVDAFRGRANPVSDEAKLTLAESMRKDGQLTAIQARQVPGTDEYECIFGNTRTLAGAGYRRGVQARRQGHSAYPGFQAAG